MAGFHDPTPPAPRGAEPRHSGLSQRLNWLRTGVLGANDGLVSTAGMVIGVAGATATRGPIMIAGIVGLVAGAVSMALGEYVSVSSQVLRCRLHPRLGPAAARHGAARGEPADPTWSGGSGTGPAPGSACATSSESAVLAAAAAVAALPSR